MELVHNPTRSTIMTSTTTKSQLNKSQQSKLSGLPSKSAKIRYLTSLSWTRRQIADKVGVIYQFVYNVQHQKTKSDK